jgi:hypothetical protein
MGVKAEGTWWGTGNQLPAFSSYNLSDFLMVFQSRSKSFEFRLGEAQAPLYRVSTDMSPIGLFSDRIVN